MALSADDRGPLADRRTPAMAAIGDGVRRAQAERPRLGTRPTALHDATESLHEQRLHKPPDELARMRHAIDIACEAHREAVKTTRPGMHEYEIEAMVDFTFRRRGAS